MTSVTLFETFFFVFIKIAFEDIYKDFFKLGLENSNLTSPKTTFKSFLECLKVNTSQVDNYVDKLGTYLSVIVEDPSSTQKDTMTAKLNDLELAEISFIGSFEGLENIENNVVFAVDPRNAIFNGFRATYSAAKLVLKLGPELSFSFFKNEDTVTLYVNLLISAIDVSNRIKNE